MSATLTAALQCTACGHAWQHNGTLDAGTSRAVAQSLLACCCPECHAINPRVTRMLFCQVADRAEATAD